MKKSRLKLMSAYALVACAATILITGKSEDADSATLSEFGSYRLTDVGTPKMNELYQALTPDLTVDAGGNCYERAHVWAYQLYKQSAVQSGKVFIFYAYRSDPRKPSSYNFNGQGWWFHVAPYVVADGKEYVLEKFGAVTQPMLFEDWAKKQTGGQTCKILSSDDRKDRKNFFKPLSNPNRRMSFTNDVAPCFIRKAPMYYKTTSSVGAQGVGSADYRFFSTQDVFNSCFNTTVGDEASRRTKCSKFIVAGNPSEIASPSGVNTAPAPTTAPESTVSFGLTPESIQPNSSGAVDSLYERDAHLLSP